MSDIFRKRFVNQDNQNDLFYFPIEGEFGEKRLLAVNHICIHHDAIVFQDIILPFKAEDILEKKGYLLQDIFEEITLILQKKENINKPIIICGEKEIKLMFGRKLEDKLKREVIYE